MNITNKKFLFLFDVLLISLFWTSYYLLRVRFGIFELQSEIDFVLPLVAILIYWIFIFFLFGLYKDQYVKSRTDEFIQIFKSVTIGSLLLYILIYVDEAIPNPSQTSRSLMLFHWVLILIIVSVGRIGLISYLRRMYLKGKYLRNTLIVGWDKKGKELFDNLQTFPAL